MESVLGHLKVIDLADENSSYCSRLLTGLGAHINTQKPALETATGRRIFRGLATDTDIIIESYAPGFLTRHRLDYSHLAALNPGLILASITPFGFTGPRRDWKADSAVISAASGLTFLHGEPQGPPLGPAGDQPLILASLYAAAGILMAISNRRITGKGRFIDISHHEAAASILVNAFVRYFSEGTVTRRNGKMRWDNLAGIFPCRDGFIFLTFDREWETIMDLMDSDEFKTGLDSPEWKDPAYRASHNSRVIGVLSKWTATYRVSQLFELGQAMRFPWAPVSDTSALAGNPQLKSRGFSLHGGSVFPGPVLEPIEDQRGDNSPRKITNRGSAALPGIRVLDFTWILAGPFATAAMADFGAEVIKVQSHKIANGTEQNGSYYFASLNRNKKSITLDMGRPEARDIVLKLAAKCDVVIQNFTPRVMENWSLGYETFKKANPGLIMVNLSAMGRTGPWRDFAALADTIEALSGMLNKDNPLLTGYPYSDIVSGLYAFNAVLAALERREQTGRGCNIDISEFEALLSALKLQDLNFFPQKKTVSEDSKTPTGALCCRCKGKDSWCIISIQDDCQWKKLMEITGQRELPSPVHGWDKADPAGQIEKWTQGFTARSIAGLLQSNGIPCSPVNSAKNLAGDTQLKAREFFRHYRHQLLGEIVYPGSPLKMSTTQHAFHKPAPLLGEDNEYVFKELLGMSQSTFDEHVKRKIIY